MLRRRTLRDDLYDDLLGRIVSGSLAPGTPLRDADLAEQLNVSRTPVREAMLRLTNEGFVETDPNRWTRVADPSPETVASWYEIIARLEALAAEKAAGTLSLAALDALTDHTDNLAAAIASGDPIAARKADDSFHRVIVTAAGRPDLTRMIEELRSKLRWADLIFFTHKELGREAVAEHRKIITALQRGNAATAAKLVQQNWERGLDKLATS